MAAHARDGIWGRFENRVKLACLAMMLVAHGVWFAGSFIGGRWHGCLMSAWLVRAGAKSALSCRFSSTTIRDTHIGRGGLSYQLINFPYYYSRLHESLDA
jgi:hypothetical protein